MNDFLPSRERLTPRLWPLAALRVYAGVSFAWHGVRKLVRDDFAGGMTGFLNGNLESMFGFYRPFVENVVLPNASLFAGLVAWGELLVGLALVVGLATRAAGLAGAFVVANFWFAKGQGMLAGQNHDVVWLVILLVLAFVPAGRVAGLDARLAGRFRFLR